MAHIDTKSGATLLVAHGAWGAGYAWKKMHPLMGGGRPSPRYADLSGFRSILKRYGIWRAKINCPLSSGRFFQACNSADTNCHGQSAILVMQHCQATHRCAVTL
jgi:hypothetical protein